MTGTVFLLNGAPRSGTSSIAAANWPAETAFKQLRGWQSPAALQKRQRRPHGMRAAPKIV